MSATSPQPAFIRMENYEEKVITGLYISRESAGRGNLSYVVLERPNGSRFREMVVASELDDALVVAGLVDPRG